jgi:hypothetical protein
MGEIYRKMETLSEEISCEIGLSYLEVRYLYVVKAGLSVLRIRDPIRNIE